MESLSIREPLGARQATLPLLLGGSGGLPLPGVDEPAGSIDAAGGQWWLRPVADSALRLNGVLLQEPQLLADGDVLQLGDAQLVFHAVEPALEMWHLAGNATVAPLQDARLPGEAVVAGAAEIQALAGAADARESGAPRTRSRSRTWWAIPLVLIAAVLGVLLRLNTVPLQLTPSAAQVRVDGWFNWRSGDRLFLMPGSHVMHVEARGYAPRELAVDAASGAPLHVELELLPGVLAVDTQGVAAEAFIDGNAAGQVPGEITAKAGARTLLLRAPRHVEYAATIEVAGGGTRQDIRATLLPAYGWLVLDTSPSGARVRVDDQDRGQAPLRLELDTGMRQLSIAAAGRRGWSSQVAIQAGQTLDLGVIDLASPAPAVMPPSTVSTAADETVPLPATAPESATARPEPAAARIQSALLGNLLLLPAGSFPEGSERREQGRRSNEVLRQVTLTRPFYLAEHEVTNAQFRAFRAEHVSGLAMEKSLDLDNQAVSNVSWNEAVEFCNWLSLREGLRAAYERRDGRWQLVQPLNTGYRLPTEAEWEYAARYVDGKRWRRYAWGDTLPPPAGAANLGGRESLPTRPGPDQRLATALPGYSDEHAVVAPVGSYAASAAGFHDLGGNVSEWTHDVYTSQPEGAAVTDPFGPELDGPHAVRGANWRTSAIAELRLAWRERGAGAAQTIGFRVARYVENGP